MTTLEEARLAWATISGRYQQTSPTRVVYLGDGRGFATSNMVVPYAQNMVYARDSISDTAFFPIQNKTIAPKFNQPVVAGYAAHDPDIEQVLDFDTQANVYIEGGGGSQVPGAGPHGQTHQFGGGDETYVDPKLFLPGLVAPTAPPSTSLKLGAFSYYYNVWDRYQGDTTRGFDRYIPQGASIRYVLIALDPETRDIVYRPGELFTTESGAFHEVNMANNGGWGLVPAPAGDEYPLGAVRLDASTTSLDWFSDTVNNIVESRLHIGMPPKKLLDRVEGLERHLGLGADQTLPATGAQHGRNKSEEFKTNAALLQGTLISESAPTNNQVLTYSNAKNAWAPQAAGAAGNTHASAQNLGTGGYGLFKQTYNGLHQFKTILAGTNITLGSAASSVTINSSGGGGGEQNDGANLGTGIEVFREKSSTTLNFRTLVAGANITIGSATSEITITGAAGGGNTHASTTNLGDGGYGLFKETYDGLNQFKTIIAGANIALASAASTVTVAVTGGVANTHASTTNLGDGGYGLFKETQAGTHQFKTLVPGYNMTLASAASAITITTIAQKNAAANIGVTTSGLYVGILSTSLLFKTISEGANITLDPHANDIEIIAANTHTSTTNLGAGGYGLFKETFNGLHQFKTILAGTNITLGSTASTVTINSSAGGGATSFIGAKFGGGALSGKSYPSGSAQYMDFPDQVYDTNSAVTNPTTDWTFTAPNSGYYALNARALFDAYSGWTELEYALMYVYVNDAQTEVLNRAVGDSGTNANKHVFGSAVLKLNLSDTVKIAMLQSSGSTLATYGNPYNRVEISYLGP